MHRHVAAPVVQRQRRVEVQVVPPPVQRQLLPGTLARALGRLCRQHKRACLQPLRQEAISEQQAIPRLPCTSAHAGHHAKGQEAHHSSGAGGWRIVGRGRRGGAGGRLNRHGPPRGDNRALVRLQLGLRAQRGQRARGVALRLPADGRRGVAHDACSCACMQKVTSLAECACTEMPATALTQQYIGLGTAGARVHGMLARGQGRTGSTGGGRGRRCAGAPLLWGSRRGLGRRGRRGDPGLRGGVPEHRPLHASPRPLPARVLSSKMFNHLTQPSADGAAYQHVGGPMHAGRNCSRCAG